MNIINAYKINNSVHNFFATIGLGVGLQQKLRD